MKQIPSALALLACLAGPALANGALASFPAGGVVFEDSADIALAEEKLFLSPGEVRVNYLFASTSGATQPVTIGFPLPRVPAAPDTPDSVQPLGDGGDDMRNYLQFGVTVDGVRVEPVLHEFAWLDGKDVSAAVRAAGLPLLPTFEETETWATLDPAVLAPLLGIGLLLGEAGGYLNPAWDYQVVYEWQQDFDPGTTAVDIRYRPLMGWPGDFGDTYEVGEHADTACVDDALRAQIARLKAENSYYEVAQLDYITTTAQHWAGPIRQFTLTVSPRSDEDWVPSEPGHVLTAMCPADTPANADGDHVWTATNYVPEKDVRVFFYLFTNQD